MDTQFRLLLPYSNHCIYNCGCHLSKLQLSMQCFKASVIHSYDGNTQLSIAEYRIQMLEMSAKQNFKKINVIYTHLQNPANS